MGKKNKKSSTDADSKIKMHKKSPTAINVGKTHASTFKALRSGKSVCSEKKHKEKYEEIKELSSCIKELTEAVKKQEEILNGVVSFMENKETPDIADEPTPRCTYECKEAFGNNRLTLLVRGFENLRPSNEIKKMLTRCFSACGEVQRVHVPFEFAFIDMRTGSGRDKALKLNGNFLRGRKLEVMDATKCGEYSVYTDFRGCDICLRLRLAHIRQGRRKSLYTMRERKPDGTYGLP